MIIFFNIIDYIVYFEQVTAANDRTNLNYLSRNIGF